MKTPEEVAEGIMPLIRDMEEEHVIKADIAYAITIERAKADALAEALRHLFGAIDCGSLEMNSEEVGGGRDVAPHPWHDEWLFYARAALAAYDRDA